MADAREHIPAYLLWYLLKIRRHAGERDFFEKRFADMSREKVLIEVQMAKQLFERGLILLPDAKKGEKVFNQLVREIAPGVTARRLGTESRIRYWGFFDLTPAGNYALRESLVQALLSGIGTFAVALIGGVAALALKG